MLEQNYQHIIVRFLSHQINVDGFIKEYMIKWKSDRDTVVYDNKFRRLINRVFTGCDCYAAIPSNPSEISEQELRQEVELLSYVWWGLSSHDGSIKTVN